MNILITTWKFSPSVGGLQTVVQVLAREFASMEYNVVVITRTREAICNTEFFSGIEVIRCPSPLKIASLYLWCDVVWMNQPSLTLGWPCFFRLRPLVTTFHNQSWKGLEKIRLVDRIKRVLVMGGVRVSVSHFLNIQDKQDAIVINNPLRPDISVDENDEPDRPLDFIYFGRIEKIKGVFLLVDSMEELVKENSSVTLTMVGEGSAVSELKKSIENRRLEGSISVFESKSGKELQNVLMKHKFVVVPSTYAEPFGLTAIEGIAAGLYPVVSDNCGLVEAVGRLGRTFSRGDRDSLISAMSDCLKMNLNVSVEERHQHLMNFSPRKVALEYVNIAFARAIESGKN